MNIDSQKLNEDTESPSVSEMDTARSTLTDMDTTPEFSAMETSGSQSLSIMDISRPESVSDMGSIQTQSIMD